VFLRPIYNTNLKVVLENHLWIVKNSSVPYHACRIVSFSRLHPSLPFDVYNAS
jgi:hypothetical protein